MNALAHFSNSLLVFCAVGAIQSQCITVTHYGRTQDEIITLRRAPHAKKNRETYNMNVDIPPSERHKRLLPYMNFYQQPSTKPLIVPHNYPPRYNILLPKHGGFQLYAQKLQNNRENPRQVLQQKQKKIKVTPFLESNALPGPFIPIIDSQIKIKENPPPQNLNQAYREPNYSYLYDQLSELKQIQQTESSENNEQKFHDKNIEQNHLQHSKYQPGYQTIISTYTPENIDILNTNNYYNKEEYRYPDYYNVPSEEQNTQTNAIRTFKAPKQKQKYQVMEPFIHQNIAIEIPALSYPLRQESQKTNHEQIVEHVPLEQPTISVAQPKPVEYQGAQNFKTNRPVLQPPPVIYIQSPQHENVKFIQSTDDVPYQPQKLSSILRYQNNNQFNFAKDPEQNHPQIKTQSQTQTPYLEQIQIPHVKPSSNNKGNAENYDNYRIQQINQVQNTQGVVQNQPEFYQNQMAGYHISNEDSKILGQILRELQRSNTLPYTLTRDNVDNSIKTLINILAMLESQKTPPNVGTIPKTVPPQFHHQQPIIKVYPEKPVNSEIQDFPADQNKVYPEKPVNSEIQDVPVEQNKVYPEKPITSEIQHFPGDSNEENTSGRPGVDYPALSTIPQTSFNCRKQRYKGFFGDPDTNCQVWHYCDLNGGQASFLCPNGTIFSQVALTCDWWYNVECSATTQLYVLNERLYKYILPLSPKFPEDYSGPLVDKYLASKFQEMEEKLKKRNKTNHNTTQANNADKIESKSDQEKNAKTMNKASDDVDKNSTTR